MNFFEEINEIKVRKDFVRLAKDNVIIKFPDEINDLLKQIKLGKDVVIKFNGFNREIKGFPYRRHSRQAQEGFGKVLAGYQ